MTKKDSAVFWDIASEYIDHHLKTIRQVSPNTVESYRNCLNRFVDYLEEEEHVERKRITFNNFDRETLKKYQNWMLTVCSLSPKTCNLRMTAVRGLLEFASQEHLWIMPLYTASCTISGTNVPNNPIEYFGADQMQALLVAPASGYRLSDRRNQMILIFLYDTAARVSEVAHLKIGDLHLDAKVPYVTLNGKGRKYRNIPLMEKTVQHLKKYIEIFHAGNTKQDSPLFYAKLHGHVSELSSDTFEKMIKKYADMCRGNGIKMPENVHCHMIRKTRAMDLYHEGIPLTHIQQLLGHENISTTSGFYAFATLDVLSKALKKVKPDEGEKVWDDPGTLDRLYKL